MKFSYFLLFILLNFSILNASSISLDEAIKILKSNNLEIQSASIDVDTAKENIKTASGNHWGKLDFIQDFASSDDAGNVFGFKVSSREATFNDFGLPDYGKITNDTPPQNLNYPDSRNFFSK